MLAYSIEDRLTLLGSVHFLPDLSDTPLPDLVRWVTKSAELVVLEADTRLQIDPSICFFDDGESLEQVVGQDVFQRSSELASTVGVPVEELSVSKPWHAALRLTTACLEAAGLSGEHGVDAIVLNTAAAAQKELLFLEELEAQLKCFDCLPHREQVSFLQRVVNQPEAVLEEFKHMVLGWMKGDPTPIAAVLASRQSDLPAMARVLVTARNRSWLHKIGRIVEDGSNVLVTVGALHLVGEEGLPALLRSEAYEWKQLNFGGG